MHTLELNVFFKLVQTIICRMFVHSFGCVGIFLYVVCMCLMFCIACGILYFCMHAFAFFTYYCISLPADVSFECCVLFWQCCWVFLSEVEAIWDAVAHGLEDRVNMFQQDMVIRFQYVYVILYINISKYAETALMSTVNL